MYVCTQGNEMLHTVEEEGRRDRGPIGITKTEESIEYAFCKNTPFATYCSSLILTEMTPADKL